MHRSSNNVTDVKAMLSALQYCLGTLSGAFVGFSLGLVGGGGSILAVPLIIYLVGVPNPHVAIGTSALSVAANAIASLLNHARSNNVEWRCGLSYALTGIVGASLGSTLGKVTDGESLLFLFGLLMIIVGALMLKNRSYTPVEARLTRANSPKVFGYGLGTGFFSGFFGIGGGFLIVPGLVASTRMPMINAVGTSLIAVAAFGLTTALNYATSNFINWPLAAALIIGGTIGGFGGTMTARRLSSRGVLTSVFAALTFIMAAYVLFKSGRF
jgi:uncharacterized protein